MATSVANRGRAAIRSIEGSAPEAETSVANRGRAAIRSQDQDVVTV